MVRLTRFDLKHTFIPLLILLFSCNKTTEFFDSDSAGFQADVIDASTTTIGGGDVGNGFVDFANSADDSNVWTPSSGDFIFTDEQTGSSWNVRGEAFDGPLKGQRLRQIPAFNAFWFAWSVFYDGSEVWNKAVNRPGAINGEAACEVPCSEIISACSGGLDCIPALDYDGTKGRPKAELVDANADGAKYLNENDFVLGVFLNGEARAYPHNILWWHEIYNDKIGDTEFSVSFCPLTGSGMAVAGKIGNADVDFGVSGNLFNSNLVMFDRQSESFFSQMTFTGIKGEQKGVKLELLPIVETTWKRWKEMYPKTKVASDTQGYTRSYTSYPYGNYRENHDDTFRPTNPTMVGLYPAKNRILGIPTSDTDRAYALPEMAKKGDRVVINDTLNGSPIVILSEAEHRLAIPFFAEIDGRALRFSGSTAP